MKGSRAHLQEWVMKPTGVVIKSISVWTTDRMHILQNYQ